MARAKYPHEAAKDYQAKLDREARAKERKRRGLPDLQARKAGEHERSYQAQLEAKGQLRMFS